MFKTECATATEAYLWPSLLIKGRSPSCYTSVAIKCGIDQLNQPYLALILWGCSDHTDKHAPWCHYALVSLRSVLGVHCSDTLHLCVCVCVWVKSGHILLRSGISVKISACIGTAVSRLISWDKAWFSWYDWSLTLKACLPVQRIVLQEILLVGTSSPSLLHVPYNLAYCPTFTRINRTSQI